jgi:hypothetical protein
VLFDTYPDCDPDSDADSDGSWFTAIFEAGEQVLWHSPSSVGCSPKNLHEMFSQDFA